MVHVEKRKAVEETVDRLYEWVDKLHVELNEAKSRVKEERKETASHQTRLNKDITIDVKRLDFLKIIKTKLNKTKDELSDESHAHAALGVVPPPDGTIYLVDINETHYWGSLVRYMYLGQKYFSEKIETYQYKQKKGVNVLVGFPPPRFIGKKKVP